MTRPRATCWPPIATNAGELRVRDFAARYVAASGPAAADGTWTARADVAWRFAGFDRAPALAELPVVFRSVDGEVGLVSIERTSGMEVKT